MDNTFWNNFLSNFLANLVSDVIVGTFLATGVAWWVGKKMSEFERSQHRKDEKRAEIEKAIRYLEFLKDEIRYLIDQLPGLIRLFEETG